MTCTYMTLPQTIQQMDHLIPIRRSDLVLIYKKKKQVPSSEFYRYSRQLGENKRNWRNR